MSQMTAIDRIRAIARSSLVQKDQAIQRLQDFVERQNQLLAQHGSGIGQVYIKTDEKLDANGNIQSATLAAEARHAYRDDRGCWHNVREEIRRVYLYGQRDP